MAKAKKIKLSPELRTVLAGRIKAGILQQEASWSNPRESESALADLRDEPTRNLALVKGTYWRQRLQAATSGGSGTGGRVFPTRTVNHICPKLRSKQDLLTSGESLVMCEPRGKRWEGDKAEEVAAFLTSVWDSMGWEDEVGKPRWDTEIFGRGCVEIGWRIETAARTHEPDDRPEPIPPPEAKPIAINTQFGTMMKPPETVTEYDTEEDAQEGAAAQEADEAARLWDTTFDDAFIVRLKPSDVISDPNAVEWDLSDARYVFIRRWVEANKLKRDTRFPALLRRKLQGAKFAVNNKTTATDLPNMGLVEIWDGHMWLDHNNDGKDEFLHIIYAQELNEPLYVNESPYMDEGKPIFPGSPFPVRIIPGIVVDNDDPYPKASVSDAASLQLDFDQAWTTLMEHARRANATLMAEQGSVDDATVKALENGEIMRLIQVKPNFMDKTKALEFPNVQPEIFQILQRTPAEISRQIGVDEFTESMIPQKVMSATEVAEVKQSGGARMAGDAKRFRQFKEDLFLCILALYQTFGVVPKEYSKKKENGKISWGYMDHRRLRGDDGAGNLEPVGIQFQIKLDVDASMPRTRELEMQNDVQFLTALAPFLQIPDPWRPGMPLINVAPILRRIAKNRGYQEVAEVLAEEPTEEDKVAQLLQKQAEMGKMIEQMQQVIQQQEEQMKELETRGNKAFREAGRLTAKEKEREKEFPTEVQEQAVAPGLEAVAGGR